MVEERKRRFWQIHLSTAIFMMVLSGAIVGLIVKQYLYIDPQRVADPRDYQYAVAVRFENTVLLAIFLTPLLAIGTILFEFYMRRRDRRIMNESTHL
jgi:hypothetical protein